MLVHIMQDWTTWSAAVVDGGHSLNSLYGHIPHDWLTLAQDGQYNQDLMKDTQKYWNSFVKSGNIWSLLIGIILGYVVRTFTSFG